MGRRAPRLAVLLAVGLVVACGPEMSQGPDTANGMNVPPDAEMNAFATRLLDGLQARSFAQAQEFCGYIIVTETGDLASTPVRGGDDSSCDPGAWRDDVVASFHTHGAFSVEYNDEVPSSDDLLGDFDFEIDGYVSTPSGRVWRIDHEDRRAYLLCDTGCVLADPNDDPDDAGEIQSSYTVRELIALEAQ